MRRLGAIWPTITSFGNLRRAALRAARGKRTVRSVAAFCERLEPELLLLQRELLAGTWQPGRPTTFTIRDPKLRTITAAPFRDRVVHHALIDPIEGWLDRRMTPHSHACRRGKGQHAARCRAQQLLRRHAFFLKLDVQGFFPSLRHDVALATVARCIKDRAALQLFERIVRHGSTDGRGLPIGNLTSQWVANLVLDRLDHLLVEVERVPGYVRYMDDFVLFAQDKPALHRWRARVAAFLADLGLQLKPTATLLAPAAQGLPFLGFRLYRGTVRIRPQNLRRTKARWRARCRQHALGLFDERRLADCVRAQLAHLAHGSTLALRQAWFHPAADRRRSEPREPRRQLRQRGRERAVLEPQRQRPDEPQRQPGAAPRHDIPEPDCRDRHQAPRHRAP